MKKRVLRGLAAAFSLMALSVFMAPQEAEAGCSGKWEDWYCTNGCSTQGFDSCGDIQQ